MIIDLEAKIKAAEKAKSSEAKKPVGLKLNGTRWLAFKAAVKANSNLSANEMVDLLIEGYLDQVSSKKPR